MNGLQPEDVKNLNIVSTSAWRLSHLVNDILDHSKDKLEPLRIEKKELSIYQQTDAVLDNIAPLITGKPVAIKNQIAPDLPKILGDENRIQQILFNLLGNSIKFTHEGEIILSAVVHDEELLVSIKDSGIGIPEENLESIFAPYRQGDPETSQTYGGTGLGLTVTRQLVELHGEESGRNQKSVKARNSSSCCP